MDDTMDGVVLNYVETTEEAVAFIEWTKRPNGPVAVDTETTGLERDAYVRLVQFGDRDVAWTLRRDRHPGAILEALDILQKSRVRMVYHNAPFDVPKIERIYGGELKIDWGLVEDTMILSRLVSPLGGHGLKALSARYVDPRARQMEAVLKDAMAANGWTWATVPYSYVGYTTYAGIDTVLTARLLPVLEAKPHVAELYQTEIACMEACVEMSETGMLVDQEYCHEQIIMLEQEIEDIAKQAHDTFGVKALGSNQMMTNALNAQGFFWNKRTEKGAVALDSDVLEELTARGSDLARTIQSYRTRVKLLNTYFRNFLLSADDNGVIHPNINTLEAVTGRMCLPLTHGLLTSEGVVRGNDVRVGMLTMDHRGKWVPVLEVHRYDNTPIQQLSFKRATFVFESTPEHKWISSWEDDIERYGKHVKKLKTIRPGRQVVHLSPRSTRPIESLFDLNSPGPSFAALIGWLVSDGSCVLTVYDSDRARRRMGGARAGVRRAWLFQTERKFLKEMLESVPEEARGLVEIGRNPDVPDGWEIRVLHEWLTPRLSSEGLLGIAGNLKDSPLLISWINRVSLEDCTAFFKAVYLADGATSQRHKIIGCHSETLRTVLAIAAYRCGYSSYTDQRPSGKSFTPGDKWTIGFRPGSISLRGAVETHTVDHTWCVTTPSGTLTAWAPGRNGPYLTGNSITNPAMQTLPRGPRARRAFISRPGHQLVLADYAQIEARLLGHFCKDPSFREAIDSSDLHTAVAGMIFGGDHITREVRQLAKTSLYSVLYGAGPEKFSQTAGVTLEEGTEFLRRYHERFPTVRPFIDYVQTIARQRKRQEGSAYVVTPAGRKLHARKIDAEYTLVNYLIQGSAADIFKQAIVRLQANGFGQHLRLPVHDECIFEIPLDVDAEEFKREVTKIMEDDSWEVPIVVEASGPYDSWANKYDSD